MGAILSELFSEVADALIGLDVLLVVGLEVLIGRHLLPQGYSSCLLLVVLLLSVQRVGGGIPQQMVLLLHLLISLSELELGALPVLVSRILFALLAFELDLVVEDDVPCEELILFLTHGGSPMGFYFLHGLQGGCPLLGALLRSRLTAFPDDKLPR